jgi:hypothetical protein
MALQFPLLIEAPTSISEQIAELAEEAGATNIAESALDAGELHLNAPDITSIIVGAVAVSVIFRSASEVLTFTNHLLDLLKRIGGETPVTIRVPRSHRSAYTVDLKELAADADREKTRALDAVRSAQSTAEQLGDSVENRLD